MCLLYISVKGLLLVMCMCMVFIMVVVVNTQMKCYASHVFHQKSAPLNNIAPFVCIQEPLTRIGTHVYYVIGSEVIICC